MRAGMKATGLAELDLAYAPSYSSAKDPVNMGGSAHILHLCGHPITQRPVYCAFVSHRH